MSLRESILTEIEDLKSKLNEAIKINYEVCTLHDIVYNIITGYTISCSCLLNLNVICQELLVVIGDEMISLFRP